MLVVVFLLKKKERNRNAEASWALTSRIWLNAGASLALNYVNLLESVVVPTD